MPTIQANGLELGYPIDGDGPETLVLVNGLADAKESWEAQIPAFAERYRVVSYDNRGVGESPTPPGPYSSAQMADDLAGLVDALGLERFHLLGVSMGGMIAQEYAIAHADRLLSASFCCTYSYPGPFCLRMFSCWRDLVPTLGVGFTQREVILWAFTTDFFEQHEDVVVEIEGLMAANPQPVEGYLAQLASIEEHDTRGRLGAVTCPVMTLVGREDILIYPKLSRRLHEELPNSKWVEVPGGHACLWEDPDAFNAAVLDYLARWAEQLREQLRLELSEPRIGQRARAGEGHGELGDDRPRPRREHVDAVGQVDRLAHVVRDQQDGPAELRPDRLQPALHLGARERVERAERLVEQQHLALLHDGAQERCALPHAARELERVRALEAVEPEGREQRAGRARAPRARAMPRTSRPSVALSSTRRHGSSASACGM